MKCFLIKVVDHESDAVVNVLITAKRNISAFDAIKTYARQIDAVVSDVQMSTYGYCARLTYQNGASDNVKAEEVACDTF